MLDTRELRIGNYILGLYEDVDDDGEDVVKENICQVISLDDIPMSEYRIWVESESGPDGPEYYDDFLGIPLTEQWLIDFGFEIQYSISYSTGRGVEYRVFSLGGFSFNEIQKNWWYRNLLFPTQPLSVHQLQNLYFALTGEDLHL